MERTSQTHNAVLKWQTVRAPANSQSGNPRRWLYMIDTKLEGTLRVEDDGPGRSTTGLGPRI
jgi:hypothetical protein